MILENTDNSMFFFWEYTWDIKKKHWRFHADIVPMLVKLTHLNVT